MSEAELGSSSGNNDVGLKDLNFKLQMVSPRNVSFKASLAALFELCELGLGQKYSPSTILQFNTAAAGLTTVRTWSFNALAPFFFQVFGEGATWIRSIANSGLMAFGLGLSKPVQMGLGNSTKYVVSSASGEAHGIRLIVTLTNNRSDYGGMDVYVKQIAGSSATHDVFYTNTAIISSYEKYISVRVNRYKFDPTIFAWEPANERMPPIATPPAERRSTPGPQKYRPTYIKSIDPNHLVARRWGVVPGGEPAYVSLRPWCGGGFRGL